MQAALNAARSNVARKAAAALRPRYSDAIWMISLGGLEKLGLAFWPLWNPMMVRSVAKLPIQRLASLMHQAEPARQPCMARSSRVLRSAVRAGSFQIVGMSFAMAIAATALISYCAL